LGSQAKQIRNHESPDYAKMQLTGDFHYGNNADPSRKG